MAGSRDAEAVQAEERREEAATTVQRAWQDHRAHRAQLAALETLRNAARAGRPGAYK